MAGNNATAAGKGDEDKGCLAMIWDSIMWLFTGIFSLIAFVLNLIAQFFQYLAACFKFVWYPIKERISICCRWCGNRNRRSNDPTYSTFANEV